MESTRELLDSVSKSIQDFEKQMVANYVPVPVYLEWCPPFDPEIDCDLGYRFDFSDDNDRAIFGFLKLDGRWRVCFHHAYCEDNENIFEYIDDEDEWTPVTELPINFRLKLLEGNPLAELENALSEKQSLIRERAKRVLQDLR